MSVKEILTVHWIRHAFPKSVSTHVWALSVEVMLYVRLSFIEQFATVLLAYKATLKCHALKSNALAIRIAPQIRFVIFHLDHKEKNAYHYAKGVLVHLVLSVQQSITKKDVNAALPWREMVLCCVLNVRKLLFFPYFESNLQPAPIKHSFILAIVTEQPECRVDPDCPSKLACISQTCQNPCVVNNPCSNSQKCVVIDSQPSRSVACICPEGSVFGGDGICTQGMWYTKQNAHNLD